MKYQRISAQKLNKIFLCFSEGITAAARIAGVNRNTVNSYYVRIRELIFEESLKVAGRELLEFCEGAAGEIQRLQFRQICATLEGVRVAVQP